MYYEAPGFELPDQTSRTICLTIQTPLLGFQSNDAILLGRQVPSKVVHVVSCHHFNVLSKVSNTSTIIYMSYVVLLWSQAEGTCHSTHPLDGSRFISLDLNVSRHTGVSDKLPPSDQLQLASSNTYCE